MTIRITSIPRADTVSPRKNENNRVKLIASTISLPKNDNLNNSKKAVKGEIPNNIFIAKTLTLSSKNNPQTSKESKAEFEKLFSKIDTSFFERLNGTEAEIALSIMLKPELLEQASDPEKVELIKSATYYLDKAKSKKPELYESLLKGIDNVVEDFTARGKMEKLVDYSFVEMSNTGLFMIGMNDWGARKITANDKILESSTFDQKVDLLTSLKRFYTSKKEEGAILKILDGAVSKGQFRDLSGAIGDNLSFNANSLDALYSDMSGENKFEFLTLVNTGIKNEKVPNEVLTRLYGANETVGDINKLNEAKQLEKDSKFSEAGSIYSKLGNLDKAEQLFEIAGNKAYSKGNFLDVTKNFLLHSNNKVKKAIDKSANSLDNYLVGHSIVVASSFIGKGAAKFLDNYPILQPKNVIKLHEQREKSLIEISSIKPKGQILTQNQKQDLSTKFEQEIDNLTGTKSHAGNRMTMLLDGEVSFNQIMKRIDESKESIYIEIFLFHDDEHGNKIADALIKKADEGLDVRVITDGPANASYRKVLNKLDKSKVKFEKYAGSFKNPIENRGMVPYHRKIYLFDKQYAMTGGINIGTDYFGETKWHDLLMEAEGPIVHETVNDFYDKWAYSSGDDLEKLPESDRPKEFSETDLGDSDAVGDIRILKTDPLEGTTHIKDWMLKAIEESHTRIMIQDPYFSDPELADAVVDATKRGVKVSVIFPGNNDQAVMKHLDDITMEKLYAAGADVYAYDTNGAEGFNHLKTTVIDDMSTIGSSNKDTRALNTNQEINYIITDKEFTEKIVNDIFEVDFKNSTPDKPESENFIKRSAKQVLSLFPSMF